MKRLIFFCAALCIASPVRSQQLKHISQEKLAQATGSACTTGKASAALFANNVIARLYNTGGLFWKGSGNFYEVPAYGGVHSIFAEGIWIGGMVGGELRFAGTSYGPHEFFPGPLDVSGNPPADCTPYDRIYVVSEKDLEAFDAGLPHPSDIEEWPWQLGAPVEDGDGNPDNYNLAGGDRPEVLGDQTAWWVMNDAAGVHGTSQTKPIQMEVQMTAFAVATSNALNNTTFYRYRLVYKGSQPLTDAWFGHWVDADLGDASDDLIGSVPALDMGYFYNGDNDDALGRDGYGVAPPALGYVLLQGPVAEDDGEDNDGDGKIDESGERIGMTKFIKSSSDSSPFGDPQNVQEMYALLRGIWRNGDPLTFGGNGYGGTTPADFMFPGDPVTRSFWSELNTDGQGSQNSPSDRYFNMSTGPFTMQPGDVQDIVLAIVWARGADNLDSVRKLREDAAFVREVFQNGEVESYPAPESLPVPDIEVTPGDIALKLGPGERNSRTLTITNTGNADLQWSFDGPGGGISRFLVTANTAGPLDPPDHGSASFNNNGTPTPDGNPVHCEAIPETVDYSICNDRPSLAQQVGPASWLWSAGGGDGTFRSYLTRSIVGRGREVSSILPFDYEWRFTGTSLALRAFEDDGIVEAPFELWNAGIHSPDDPSDDVRLIPLICEAACGGGTTAMAFDVGGDHPISGAANDPLTDWIYWYAPVDESPGDAGYNAYADAARAGDIQKVCAALGEEVLARQVLVGFNLGTAPPYPQELPEPGTIFRLETAKSWVYNTSASSGNLAPGESTGLELDFGVWLPPPGVYQDTLMITSRVPDRPEIYIPVSLEVVDFPTSAESDELPDTYTLQQNYPNPFNPSTTIRYGLPVAGQVRIVLYDALGRRINVLEEGVRGAGWHTIDFDAASLPAGLYFYRLETNGVRDVKSMLLVK